MRAWRLAACVALGGCFSDPDAAGDGPAPGSSGTTTDATSAGPGSGTPGDSGDSGDSVGATSDATGDVDPPAGTDDSTGGPPAPMSCNCPPGAWLCESFEDFPERSPPPPWSYPLMGSNTLPAAISGDTPCDDTMLRAAVPTDGQFSAAVANFPVGTITAGEITLGAWIRFSSSCQIDNTGSRLLELFIDGGGAKPLLVASLWTGAAGGYFVLQSGTATTPVSFDGRPPAFVPDTWFFARVDVDFTDSPPEFTVMIDDDITVTTAPDGADAATPSRAPFHVTVGPYRSGSPFLDECTIDYDVVWFAPTPA